MPSPHRAALARRLCIGQGHVPTWRYGSHRQGLGVTPPLYAGGVERLGGCPRATESPTVARIIEGLPGLVKRGPATRSTLKIRPATEPIPAQFCPSKLIYLMKGVFRSPPTLPASTAIVFVVGALAPRRRASK